MLRGFSVIGLGGFVNGPLDLPEELRKPGLLNDSWFDVDDLRFERAFLTQDERPAGEDPARWLAACVSAAERREADQQTQSRSAGCSAGSASKVGAVLAPAGRPIPNQLPVIGQEPAAPILRGNQTQLQRQSAAEL